MGLTEFIIKARSGRYADTPENRRLHRVGQEYGSKKQPDEQGGKPTAKKEQGAEEKPQRTAEHSKRDISILEENREKIVAKYGEDAYNKKLERLKKERADFEQADTVRQLKERADKEDAEKAAKEKEAKKQAKAERKEYEENLRAELKDAKGDEYFKKVAEKFKEFNEKFDAKMKMDKFLWNFGSGDAKKDRMARKYVEAVDKGATHDEAVGFAEKDLDWLKARQEQENKELNDGKRLQRGSRDEDIKDNFGNKVGTVEGHADKVERNTQEHGLQYNKEKERPDYYKRYSVGPDEERQKAYRDDIAALKKEIYDGLKEGDSFGVGGSKFVIGSIDGFDPKKGTVDFTTPDDKPYSVDAKYLGTEEQLDALRKMAAAARKAKAFGDMDAYPQIPFSTIERGETQPTSKEEKPDASEEDIKEQGKFLNRGYNNEHSIIRNWVENSSAIPDGDKKKVLDEVTQPLKEWKNSYEAAVKNGTVTLDREKYQDELKTAVKASVEKFDKYVDSSNRTTKLAGEKFAGRVKFDDMPNAGKVNLKKYLRDSAKETIDQSLKGILEGVPKDVLQKQHDAAVKNFNDNFDTMKKSERARALYGVMQLKQALSKAEKN